MSVIERCCIRCFFRFHPQFLRNFSATTLGNGENTKEDEEARSLGFKSLESQIKSESPEKSQIKQEKRQEDQTKFEKSEDQDKPQKPEDTQTLVEETLSIRSEQLSPPHPSDWMQIVRQKIPDLPSGSDLSRVVQYPLRAVSGIFPSDSQKKSEKLEESQVEPQKPEEGQKAAEKPEEPQIKHQKPEDTQTTLVEEKLAIKSKEPPHPSDWMQIVRQKIPDLPSGSDLSRVVQYPLRAVTGIFPSRIPLLDGQQQKKQIGQEEKSLVLVKKKPNRQQVIEMTRALVQKLLQTKEDELALHAALLELKEHLMEFPASRKMALQIENAALLPFLKSKKADENLPEKIRKIVAQNLVLCGHIGQPGGRGIRVLSIDGGGTRGIMALECLAALEREAGGKKIHEMFDLIVGVSTGAIIATLVGAKRMTIQQAMAEYGVVSRELFNYDRIWGSGTPGTFGRTLQMSKLSKRWSEILQEKIGQDFFMDSISTNEAESAPKMAIISCVRNTNFLMPFLFRNYEHPVGNHSHYRGSTKYKFWQALLASTAAPTYFKSVELDEFLHQDGGVLINNPTIIALHEARQLWPNHEFQCVGNGRIMPEIEPTIFPEKSSRFDFDVFNIINVLGTVVDDMIESATETEISHHCIADLLPPKVYYRLNPYMSKKYELHTTEPELLEWMRTDAKLYVRRNREKLEAAAQQLTRPKSLHQRVLEKLLQLRR